MLRVREDQDQAARRLERLGVTAPARAAGTNPRTTRLAALAALGLALGAGGVIGAVSLVQAGDDAGVRAFHAQEAAYRRTERAPQRAIYTSATAYAPARSAWSLPLLETRSDGRIAHPPLQLNPFRAPAAATTQPQQQQRRAARARSATDVVSGSGDAARTICVRLCDGFHAPIGNLRAQSDMKAHDALCQAMNPGIPVKVFRVAAGADTIDGAVAADGKTYGALPVAYGHEKSADPMCRPPIVASNERRISLLRDFTLRAGDSVVLDGKVKTFAGSTKWPYRTRDFTDFRSSDDLSAHTRRQIDDKVGVSRVEAQMQALKRRLRVREAALHDDNRASDAVTLRGTLDPQVRGPVRIVTQSPFQGAR